MFLNIVEDRVTMEETSQNVNDTLGGTQMTLLRSNILQLDQHYMCLFLVSCFSFFFL